MTDGNHELSNLHTKHVLPLYARIDALEAQLREAKAQTYCQICGSILSGDGRWQRVEDANTRLRAEANKHRNRANEVRAAWEVHRDFCAQYKIREELAAAFGTEDPVEAAKVLRQMRIREARLREDLATVLELLGPVTDYRQAIEVSAIRARLTEVERCH